MRWPGSLARAGVAGLLLGAAACSSAPAPTGEPPAAHPNLNSPSAEPCGWRADLRLTTLTRSGLVLELASDQTMPAPARRRWAERSLQALRRVVEIGHLAVSERVQLEVVPDAEALERSIAATPGSYAAIAGVTTAAPGTARSCVRVVLNAARLAEMTPAGVDALLRHELVHLVNGDAADDGPTIPRWLSEGEADRIALADVRRPQTQLVSPLRHWLRTHPVPTSLPSDREFDPNSPQLEVTYQQAWLAARILARWDRGANGATAQRLREALVHGESLSEGFAAAGVSQQQLVQSWRRELHRIAQSASSG